MCLCVFLLLYVEIFVLAAPAKQMCLRELCFAQGFFMRWQNCTYLWDKCCKWEGRYGAAAAAFSCCQLHTNALWCDTIPPPAALQPELHSPWDETRTKTDKLTVVCNLPVKAEWKRSTAAFNLAVEPCSGIFSSTFQKLHWSATRLPALLGGRLLVPNQVFISPLLSSSLLRTYVVNPVDEKGDCHHSTVLSHPKKKKNEVAGIFFLLSCLPLTCHVIASFNSAIVRRRVTLNDSNKHFNPFVKLCPGCGWQKEYRTWFVAVLRESEDCVFKCWVICQTQFRTAATHGCSQKSCRSLNGQQT